MTGIGATGLTAQNGIELYGITDGSVSGTTVTGNSYTSPGFTLDNGNYATGTGILAINVSDLSLTGDHVNNNDDNIVGVRTPATRTSAPRAPGRSPRTPSRPAPTTRARARPSRFLRAMASATASIWRMSQRPRSTATR